MTRVPRSALEGNVALVTGGVGGIGRAVCAALTEAGASVAVGHLGQPVEAAAIADALAGPAIAVEADVTAWEDMEAALDRIESELGPLDILVNNAGIMEERPLESTGLADWQRTLDVDLTGVFVGCRLAAPRMLANGGGAIVSVSSQLALRGAPGLAAYCAAKAGVLGLTRALAREVGPRVRVNAIAPGPVETEMIAPYADPDWVAQRTGQLVSGRLGTPEEIAPAVVFLASEDAALFHGQCLHVNGGGVML